MDKQALIAELDDSTKAFLDVLATIDPERFMHQPSPAQWSAAQIAEHLLLIDGAAIKAMLSSTIPTNRKPDEKLATIKWAMQSENKFVAPTIVVPTNAVKDIAAASAKMTSQREKLKEIITTTDLTEACTAARHPALGTLTRLEWVYFIINHMHRHTAQLAALPA